MDDMKGLPDVDLSPIIKDIEKTASESQPQQVKEPEGKPQDLAQFKSPEELLRGYKELQAYATKVSQENKAIREQSQKELAEIKERMELSALQQQQQYIPPQYVQPQMNQYGQPVEEPLEVKIDRTVAIREIAGVLEEEADKNRNEFQERYAYAQYVSREYPNLARSSRGVKKLFELGDKLRSENMKRNAGKALESIFGEPLGDAEITRLRTLVKGDKAITQQNFQSNAYMPDTSTSYKSGSDQNRIPNVESELNESVKKGDVDGTLNALFKKVLAE